MSTDDWIGLAPTMIDLKNYRVLDVLVFAIGFWSLYRVVITIRARARTTQLHGPRAKSWLFGVSKEVFEGDSGVLYEKWAQTYGPVFQVPGPMGGRLTVLMDPKAITQYLANTRSYFKRSFTRKFLEDLVRNLLRSGPRK